MKEFDFINLLRRNFPGDYPASIGDDAALFGGNFLIAKDILVENIHFLPSAPLDLVIGKLFTANISDIAAMGGKPSAVLLGVACKEGDLEEIAAAVIEHSAYYGVKVIGGDTCASRSGLFLSATVIGEKGANILQRNGAKPGDVIYLSRSVGLAQLSLEKELGKNNLPIDKYYHYSLKAETAVGLFLGIDKRVSCCCDISDGLGRDLSGIASESGVKAVVDFKEVDLSYLDKFGVKSFDFFLSSGEEFALLFAVRGKDADIFEKDFESRFCMKPLKIGFFSEGKGCEALLADGSVKDISKMGFQHFSHI